MFTQRLAGWSVAAITRALNERAVPCPSSADPERNPHRTGERWTLRTVAAILANPRYTGRQVWNRQHTDRGPPGETGDVLARADARRWNLTHQWVVSKEAAHPALVSEEDFIAAQQVSALSVPDDCRARRYLLVGLIRCQLCGRMMDSHWVNNHAGYRCRHGNRSAGPAGSGRPRNVYVHEEKAIRGIATQLDMSSTSPEAIADHLREHYMIVTCGVGGVVTLEASPNIDEGDLVSIPLPRVPAETPTVGLR
jgi:hypothetical protein